MVLRQNRSKEATGELRKDVFEKSYECKVLQAQRKQVQKPRDGSELPRSRKRQEERESELLYSDLGFRKSRSIDCVNCGQSEFKNENRKTGYKLLQHFKLK
jgi:hypothetical protein